MRYTIYSILKKSPLVVVVLLFVPQMAQAYIDPGTGSYLLQILIAGAVGVLFTIRTSFTRIKLFFVHQKEVRRQDNAIAFHPSFKYPSIGDEIIAILRFFRMEKKERDVVIYAETIGDYSFFEDCIQILTDVHHKRISYITSNRLDPLLLRRGDAVNCFYINYFFPFFIRFLKSRALIMTMPDLGRFHVKRSLRDTNHVYIFHNIGSSFQVLRYGALFHYDTIFCVGPHHEEEIRKQEELYRLPQKRLVKFGYPKLDKIYQRYQEYRQENRKQDGRVKILIAPGWGKWGERDGLLDVCGETLIHKLIHEGYDVVLRPHPMIRKRYPEFLDGLYNLFKEFDQFTYEEDIASLDTFFNADIMISDWSGVVYEYAFGTERPVLFINTPFKVNNPRYKELGIEPIDMGLRNRIGKILKPEDIDRVGEAIEELRKNKDAYRAEIVKARGEYVYNFQNSAKVGAEHIYELC